MRTAGASLLGGDKLQFGAFACFGLFPFLCHSLFFPILFITFMAFSHFLQTKTNKQTKQTNKQTK